MYTFRENVQLNMIIKSAVINMILYYWGGGKILVFYMKIVKCILINDSELPSLKHSCYLQEFFLMYLLLNIHKRVKSGSRLELKVGPGLSQNKIHQKILSLAFMSHFEIIYPSILHIILQKLNYVVFGQSQVHVAPIRTTERD